jgi:dethiobiotin synthetase
VNYFITGIGTEVGKTVVSAILVEALGADYWKPVQCGLPRDTEVVAGLVSNKNSIFHEERHLLTEPASPHQAAANQGIGIRLSDFSAPETENDLVVEGAGGIMVPLNQDEFMLDLIERFADRLILVSNLYLGSINHSLLSIDALKARGLEITGIVFNGPSNLHSEQIIQSYSGSKCWLRLEPESKIDPQNIKRWAQILRRNLVIT